MDTTKQNPTPDDRPEVSYTLDEQFAIIEACLFAAGHPLTYSRLAEVLHISPAECADVVEKLSVIYNSDDAFPRGVMLVRFPDSCQLCTKELYGLEIKEALGIRRGGKLSQSLLEVLAVIAYNQPVTRSYVDTVRGVDSGYAMNALLEKSLIESCGRLDAPGRPALYRTTTDFLRVFGLSELGELPTVKVRSDSGEPIEITASDASPDVQVSDTPINEE
ncbi:MAG: SMC-Scp complex subunit ScpB [Clostridia bacterium]|nr:SMC-Scp complex subunit ScpB [Clostridia bacterium]MBQ8370736.1 SMC-Scp complex subunit ScpB [Clostridia bacterium]MBQ8513002.1 SMC-Scp complex subunit ScpB [Clostridia bacterium]